LNFLSGVDLQKNGLIHTMLWHINVAENPPHRSEGESVLKEGLQLVVGRIDTVSSPALAIYILLLLGL
jgi:hypothetical protein